MPERWATGPQPEVHAARRERSHGRHPRAQADAGGCGRRVAGGESRCACRLVRRRHDLRRQARAACGGDPGADGGAWRARLRGRITAHKIPLGPAVESAIDFIKANGRAFFAGVSTVIQGSVDGVNGVSSRSRAWCLSLRSQALPGGCTADPAGPVRDRRAALHHEPGLLGGDARDAFARHRLGAFLDADRRGSGSPRRTGRGCSQRSGPCWTSCRRCRHSST